jgi:hypothetical protein
MFGAAASVFMRASSSWRKGGGPVKFANPGEDAALSHSSWRLQASFAAKAARYSAARVSAPNA